VTVTTAIQVLEKRREWLLQRIADRNKMQQETSYDRGEEAAITLAVRYLRLHEGDAA
jgi:hypothetical protein